VSDVTDLLQARGLVAGFGAQTVLHGVDLDVPAGQVTGIFGLNGAGKSVLLKVIAGVVPTRSGSITLAGTQIARLGAERRVALGMAHVPQGRQMFRSLTVEQNLRVGAHVLRRRDRTAYGDELERVFALFPLLAERRRQMAGTLSGGQQAMLAVGRALISRPRIVLIDEPSAGLAPAVVEELLESLLRIREQGLTMLLVEQNIRFGLRLADNACLLQRGRIVYSGSTGDLDSEQLATYLGVGRLLRGDLDVGLDRGRGAIKEPAGQSEARTGNRRASGGAVR
jgi:branched-chain amino acid transport system ATP-binding protein